MKFQAGDLVWVLDSPNGELPEVVKGVSDSVFCSDHGCPMYDIQGYNPICETLMRPRRDDYQMREKPGSLEIVRSLMRKQGALLIA